jgi:two-component system, response regulator PdtaR
MHTPLSGRRILVVEDQYLIAMEVEDILRSLGAEVVGPFPRLHPAFQAVRHEELHGAVLDVRLDGETINDLAALLVARGVPVLLMTGYGTDQLPPELRHLPRLQKPFAEDELRALVAMPYAKTQPLPKRNGP